MRNVPLLEICSQHNYPTAYTVLNRSQTRGVTGKAKNAENHSFLVQSVTYVNFNEEINGGIFEFTSVFSDIY